MNLVDYHCNFFAQSSLRCMYLLHYVLTYSCISSSHHRCLMSLSSEVEPGSYQEALQHQWWRDEMKAKIEALELNQTWDIVDTPPSARPIGCKWVYKIKQHSDGSVERYKAQLVAKVLLKLKEFTTLKLFPNCEDCYHSCCSLH